MVDKIATGSYLRYLTPDELRQGYNSTLYYKIELYARSWKPPEKRFIRKELSDGKVRYCDSWSINASSEQSAQEIAKALKHLIILYGGN